MRLRLRGAWRTDSLTPVVVICGVSGGAGTLAFTILAPLLPRYVHRFGLDLAQASVLSACFGLGALAGALAGGILARRSARSAIVIGLSALALGTAALGDGSSVQFVELGRVLQGAGDGLAYCGALTLLFESAPRQRQSLLLGTVSAISLLGALAGPLIAYATTRLGTGAVLGALAGLGAAVTLGAAVFRIPAPPSSSRTAGAVRRWHLPPWGRTIGPAALQAALNGTLNILGPLALSRSGWSTGGIAGAFLGAAAVGGLIYPVVGRLSDRHGTRIVIAVLLGLAGAGGCWLATTRSHWALLAAVSCSSLVFSVLSVPAIGRVTAAAREAGASFGVSSAACLVLWAVFNAGGALAGGGLAEAVGTSTPWVVLAVVCFGSGGLMYARRPRAAVASGATAGADPAAIGRRVPRAAPMGGTSIPFTATRRSPSARS
jgi:MFS family permease